MNMPHHLQKGFTLIELMIAVAIIAIISAIAIPAYNGYIHNARMVEGQDSIVTLQLAQLEFFEENGFFFVGGSTAGVIAASTGLWTPTPWDNTPGFPQATNIASLNFNYVINNCAGGAVDGAGRPVQCYTIVATGIAPNLLPARDIIIVTQ